MQQYLYGLEWTSVIDYEPASDTLEMYEIALYSNGHRMNIPPDTDDGINQPEKLTDGIYGKNGWTYPIRKQFDIEFDFNGTLLPVDYIRFVTNCGDDNPSDFCLNNKLVLMHPTEGPIVRSIPLTSNINHYH